MPPHPMQQQQMYFIHHEGGPIERAANHDYPHAKDYFIGQGYLTAETTVHVGVTGPPLPRSTILYVPLDDNDSPTVALKTLADEAKQMFEKYFGRFTRYDLVPGRCYSVQRPFTDSQGRKISEIQNLTFRFIRPPFTEACFFDAAGRYVEIYLADIEDLAGLMQEHEQAPS
ncbi:MAG: hypothetical protein ACR2OZ_19080 [Verrucomicrobiales bacterium]